jgi:hypothetical protein
MLEKLRVDVCKANLDLVAAGLVIQTWGNVSGIARDRGIMVIKPSGVPYDSMRPKHMVLVSLSTGKVLEGKLKPSSDTDTHLELLEPYLDSIDYVQFMGIKRIGVQGQPFSSDVLNKIKMFRSKHPQIPVQVDGGVSVETATLLLSLGVSRLVIGSRLWNSDNPEQVFTELTELGDHYGLYE